MGIYEIEWLEILSIVWQKKKKKKTHFRLVFSMKILTYARNFIFFSNNYFIMLIT
jgi:N-glycosylase/DNA lyase